jgi:lysophospholipase L1-like esterase
MLVQDLNAVIKATPSAAGMIDLNSALSDASWTTDGIHFGPDGYAIWTKTVVDGIMMHLAAQISGLYPRPDC